MFKNGQHTHGQRWLPFLRLPGGSGKNQHGGVLKNAARMMLFFLIFSLLPNAQPQVSLASAQASLPIYMPYVSRPGGPVVGGPGEWPMAGANPQRTSWTPSEVTGSLKPEWYTYFDSYISQKVQIIAAANMLFISAADGLHALDASSGGEIWFFPMAMPPGNAPTFANATIYLGGLDGKIYALDAGSGALKWAFTAPADFGRKGFETNPLVVNGMVYAGNRDGYMYAVRADNGQLAWRYKTDGPVLYSAAASSNNSVIYFASNDMYAYALNASTGALVWKSEKLPGTAFQSWWPVVYRDTVVFSGTYSYRSSFAPDPGSANHFAIDRAAFPSGTAEGGLIGPTSTESGDWAAGTRTINAASISQYYEANALRRSTFVLNQSNGRERTYDSDRDGRPEYAPFLFFGTQSGNRYPPVVGADDVIYQSNNYIYSSGISRGHITGWKMDTTTISAPGNGSNAVDEPLGYAVGGNTVYWKLCCDRKAGSFNLANGSSALYYDQGGMRLRRTLPELFNEGWDYAYWKHGDTTPPVPYKGRVYMINNNAVVAFSANGLNPVLPLDESRGTATGIDAEDIERATTVPGLNTKVTTNTNTWPLLIQQERYYELREDLNTRAAYFSLFEVAGSSSATPTALSTNNTNTTANLTSTFSGGQTLRTRISNRTPTILFENTSSQYQLRGSFAGIAYPTSAGVQIRTANGDLPAASLTEGWLLVWDGVTSHRWAPMVITLQNRPTQITFSTTGILMNFSGTAGSLAVTPLYGMSAPKSNEVNTWRTSIPDATRDRARLLNSTARSFPISSTDNMSINSSGDVTLSYSYSLTSIPPSAEFSTSPLQIAYLPPQLALAAWNGSPITISGGALRDLGFVTPVGRVSGTTGTAVTAVLPGLANYWRTSPAAGGGAAANDPLQMALQAEIQKMLAAGHLQPGYGRHGIWDSKASDRLGADLADYFHNPAETINTLVMALPLLPASLQTQVRTYLTNEFNSFPTYQFGHVGWNTGASRDMLNLPPEVSARMAGFEPCGVCTSGWGFPDENYYASWKYAATQGNAAGILSAAEAAHPLETTNQAIFRQSMAYALNSQIAGTIGYLRLANQTPKAGAEKTMVDLLVLRAALSKYPSALQQTGFEYGGYKWAMRTYAPNMPDTLFVLRTLGTNWSQTPLYGFQIDLIYGLSGPGTGGAYVFGIDYVNLTPELASFMRAYTLNEEQAAIADYQQRAPYWFVSEAEEGAGEGVVRPIYEGIALFNAKAMIIRQSRAQLEPYIDVPAVPIGDLYYIQKLILAIQAGG